MKWYVLFTRHQHERAVYGGYEDSGGPSGKVASGS